MGEVGFRIRAKRIALKMTQGALALAVGVSLRQVQKWEKGRDDPGSGRLPFIAKALGTTPNELVGGAPTQVISGAGGIPSAGGFGTPTIKTTYHPYLNGLIRKLEVLSLDDWKAIEATVDRFLAQRERPTSERKDRRA